MLSIVLCQLLVVIIIALTIAIASGQQLFHLLPESGLQELDVPWGVMMLTNRWFWLVKDEHKEKKWEESDSSLFLYFGEGADKENQTSQNGQVAKNQETQVPGLVLLPLH